MQGEFVTGVTIMRMEAGLDCGPILMQRAVGIGINDTSTTLHEELAETGAELLRIGLRRLLAGTLPETPQDHARATYAHKLRKEDGLLDLSWGSRQIHAHIRGVTPWPAAPLVLHREGQADLAVLVGPGIFPLTDGMNRAIVAREAAIAQESPQRIRLVEGTLLLSCGDGGYAFTSLRPAGGKSMDAAAFYNGYIAGARGAHFSGRRSIAASQCQPAGEP
jgi:methionyl-tRNA formyltransferase